MKRLLITLAIIFSGFGLNANAQRFSVGLNLGLPSLLEARIAYETPEFGIRLYYGAPFILPSVGVDAYAIVANPLGSWRFGAGLGTLSYTAGNYNDRLWLALRGLVGFKFDLGSNLGLALEWRPGIPFQLESGTGSLGVTEWLLILALSFGVSLEFRI